ncbi:BrnA antitoxin family protein [Lentisphaera marina]|uniref:BrnA antitoxin family protein n=1 Tax=Lentisphaera marina TaxID=1111041 RepID=UPI002366A21F|nr:BrnA antitoxin family protein [Lentisphaera marina]MDD7986757.1 BrnA antitoxin family protein [Lentisphaera marina]
MKEEYDLSKMESRKNPYAKALKKQVTIRVRPDVINYFKDMSEESGIPYQSLINLYLQDCVSEHRKLKMDWSA